MRRTSRNSGLLQTRLRPVRLCPWRAWSHADNMEASLRMPRTTSLRSTASVRDAELAAFYREHSEDAFRLAYLTCRDHDRAADIAAEAMERVVANWETQRPEYPKAYLRRLIVNITIDQGRRRHNFGLRLPKIVSPTTAVDHIAAVDDRSALAHALDELAPNARAAIVLRYWFDQSVDEIATTMDVPRGTVGTLLSRSLPVLHKHLDNGESQ